MATKESSAVFSGKTWGGYCQITYTAGSGSINITGMAFKATNSTSAGYGAYYDNQQTITITAGSKSTTATLSKVRINSTSYTTATFSGASFTGLSGSTSVSFTCRARADSPYNLTFSYSIDAGNSVVKPTVSGLSVSTVSETSLKASFTITSNGGATATGHITCNGVTKTGTSATFTGLSAGKSYTVTAYASNSAGNSSTLSGTGQTWAYPSVTSAPTFNIGATNVSIPLSNSHNRSVSVAIKYGSTTIRTLSTTSGSVTYNSSLDSATWYSKIPNNPSGAYSVTATCDGVPTTAKSGTFYANQTDCTPTFSNYTWADTNATTVALTGNNQVVVNGYSNLTATITSANKATAKNSASIQKYVFKNGSQTKDISYSSSATVSNTISNATSNTLQVWAIDSRNFPSATVTKTGTFINYTSLEKTEATIERVGEVSSQTTLSFKGKYWNGNFGSTTNSIQSATYKYKTGSGGWTTGTTDITPTINGNVFSFEGLVLGDDVENAGFNVQNVYTVVVTVTDKLSTAEWTLTLNSGAPHIAYHKNGISIMGKYDEGRDDALQVNGNINISGDCLKNGLNMFGIGKTLYTGDITTTGEYNFLSDASDCRYAIIELSTGTASNRAYIIVPAYKIIGSNSQWISATVETNNLVARIIIYSTYLRVVSIGSQTHIRSIKGIY